MGFLLDRYKLCQLSGRFFNEVAVFVFSDKQGDESAVGGENIFADADGNWAEVSWEEVLERDPDAIVIVDASWDPAQDKIDLLTTDPLYSTMTAVQNEAFITIPFSATTLGVRNANAVIDIAAGLASE